MKNLILLILALFFSSISLLGQLVQYFDGVDTIQNQSIFIKIDTVGGNIWQIGKPQKTIFDSAATFPNALVTDTLNFYPPNDTSSFSFDIHEHQIPLWGVVAIQWKQKIDYDTIGDAGLIEFSIDSGGTWLNAFDDPNVYNFYGFNLNNKDTLPDGSGCFSGTDSLWRDVWLCFDYSWLSTFNQSIQVRYTSISDSINSNNEGWMIDNMSIHLTYIHTINEIEQKDYIKLTPNPTSGLLEINAKKIKDFHIIESMELINGEGRIVQAFGVCPTKFKIDLSNYPNGIYYLKIKTNIKTETVKVVVQHD